MIAASEPTRDLFKEQRNRASRKRDSVDRTIHPEYADRTIRKVQNNPARRLESLKKARNPEEERSPQETGIGQKNPIDVNRTIGQRALHTDHQDATLPKKQRA